MTTTEVHTSVIEKTKTVSTTVISPTTFVETRIITQRLTEILASTTNRISAITSTTTVLRGETITVTSTITSTTTVTVTRSSTGIDASIMINEVEQNLPGTDEGNEWVELYNPNDFAVDISGWGVSTTAGATVTVTIPAGTTIPAKSYYVVTFSGQWLDNSGERVILRDAAGTLVDQTGILNDEANDGRSWQRVPDGSSNWVFRTSTRGASNSS